MKIDVKDDKKTVSIWLTNEEKNDPSVSETLKPLFKQYKDKNYLVAVFKSGEGNMSDLTSDLICYNRKKIAQHAVRAEVR